MKLTIAVALMVAATPLLAQQPDLSGHWTFNAAQSDNPRDMLQGRDSTGDQDRKSTRLNSSHSQISYAVFCLKKKKKKPQARSNVCVAAEALMGRVVLDGVFLPQSTVTEPSATCETMHYSPPPAIMVSSAPLR